MRILNLFSRFYHTFTILFLIKSISPNEFRVHASGADSGGVPTPLPPRKEEKDELKSVHQKRTAANPHGISSNVFFKAILGPAGNLYPSPIQSPPPPT